VFGFTGSGIIGLTQKFKIMDQNGDGNMRFGEFKKALRECGLTLSDPVL
jgi:Ca2+-binding EF-hand superfamily protein